MGLSRPRALANAPAMSDAAPDERAPGRREAALALVFGLVSVPWTFGFEQVAGLPLWPAFVASATYFASPGGARGLARGLTGNLVGAGYAVATLALVAALGYGALGLSLLVGAGMLVAGLHAFVPLLSMTPAAFLGYATAFSVHAADATLYAGGFAGEALAVGASLAIGAAIGIAADGAAGALGPRLPGNRG